MFVLGPLLHNTAAFANAAVWTPPSAAITIAYWYDPSDLTTLFKDTAGTTPVTADGDLVALMKDKSGLGNDATQATSGLRPIYRTGSGKPYLEVSAATPTVLETASIALTDGSGQHSCGAAVIFTNNTGTQHVLSADSGTRLSQLIRNNAGTPEVVTFGSGGNATDGGPSITAAVATTLIEVTATASSEMFTNGSSNGFTAPPSGLNSFNHILGVCAVSESGGSGGVTGKFYGAAGYKGPLSGGDVASLHTYLFGKM